MIKEIAKGTIGLLRVEQDGSIVQIALTESQSALLQMFLVHLSKDSPLIVLGKEYNLKLENNDR